MKIKQWTLLLLTCCLMLTWGCASKQTADTTTQPAATGQPKSQDKGLIGGTISGTGKIIGSTFNAADNLMRDTISLIPFVDIRKAKNTDDAQQTSQYRKDFPIAATDLIRMGLKVHWASNLDVPDSEHISQWALLDGGYLITIESPSNLFTLVNLRDGSIVWRQLQGQVTDRFYQPFRYGDFVCVNSETHMLKIDIKTGRAEEIAPLKAVVNNSPAHVMNFAIFGSLNGRIFAHDINTGFAKWDYQMQAGITARPVASKSSVLVGDSSGVYILLNAHTGKPSWKGRTFRQIAAPCAISMQRNIALIPSEDQTLYALDLVMGNDVWQYHASRPLTHQPIIEGDVVFLPITNRGLYALNLMTGKPLWHTDELLHPFDISDNEIYCYKTNSLWILEKDSGKTITQIPTADLQDIMALGNNQILVITQTGRLLKLQR